MIMSIENLRCAVRPGDGIVGRWPGAVALFIGGQDVLGQLFSSDANTDLQSLLEAARAIDWGPTGGGFGVLIQYGDKAIVQGAGSCDVILGNTRLPIDDTALEAPLHVVAPIQVMDRRLPTSPIQLAADSALNLMGGLVPGGGFGLLSTTGIPTSADHHDPTGVMEIPTPPVEFERFAIDEPPSEPPAPLPIVQPVADDQDAARESSEDESLDQGVQVRGILCSRRHFNHPEAQYCMICGISMAQLTNNLVPGPRPTLGYIVLDDGTSYHLSHGYEIGRNPETNPELGSLVLRDEGISRQHARIVLDQWSVTIIDLGSTNGTRYRLPGNDDWTDLTAHKPVALQPGSSVNLGGHRSFAFEAVHRLGR